MREGGAGRERLGTLLPGAPRWMRQVHGRVAMHADASIDPMSMPEGDAAVTRERGTVCAVLVADCLPVLLASRTGDVVAVAHAGWRGLAAGVIEAALDAMQLAPGQAIAWLGPAIGPRAYEVGAEVHATFVARDVAAQAAFRPSRPGHWWLDLYAVARQRLASRGVTQVCGGRFCTHTEAGRFYSWRRERTPARMAALIWLT